VEYLRGRGFDCRGSELSDVAIPAHLLPLRLVNAFFGRRAIRYSAPRPAFVHRLSSRALWWPTVSFRAAGMAVRSRRALGRDYEIMDVDDGSTDGSWEVLRALAAGTLATSSAASVY
jgi:hypothetical protein